MALSAPTQLTNLESAVAAGNQTTASVAVSTGDLVIVAAALNGADAFTVTSLTNSAGFAVDAWTKHEDELATNTNQLRCVVWTAQVTSGGTGTVTVTVSVGDLGRWNVQVFSVTGHNTSTPVAQSETAQQGAGASLTVTLGSSPAATSMVMGFLAQEGAVQGTVTPGSGFTELYDTDQGSGGTAAALQSQYDLAGADTTCDWSNLTSGNKAAIALEIAEAGGGARRWLLGAR